MCIGMGATVGREAHAALKHQKPAILWFTGLSGAGKSTIANLVEAKLHARGVHTTLLDGDNVRHGLNKDLGFTAADRVENIRRVGEVARLMTDAGLIVLCSFISPFRAERRLVRDTAAEGEFIEIFVDAPLETAIARDPKGLYKRALGRRDQEFHRRRPALRNARGAGADPQFRRGVARGAWRTGSSRSLNDAAASWRYRGGGAGRAQRPGACHAHALLRHQHLRSRLAYRARRSGRRLRDAMDRLRRRRADEARLSRDQSEGPGAVAHDRARRADGNARHSRLYRANACPGSARAARRSVRVRRTAGVHELPLLDRACGARASRPRISMGGRPSGARGDEEEGSRRPSAPVST